MIMWKRVAPGPRILPESPIFLTKWTEEMRIPEGTKNEGKEGVKQAARTKGHWRRGNRVPSLIDHQLERLGNKALNLLWSSWHSVEFFAVMGKKALNCIRACSYVYGECVVKMHHYRYMNPSPPRIHRYHYQEQSRPFSKIVPKRQTT